MATEVCAGALKNDLVGQIAIDGLHNLTVANLAGRCPRGYWPVGLELCFDPELRNGFSDPAVSLYVVDCAILDGVGAAAINKYAKQYGQLPVFRVETDLTLASILSQIARLNIVLVDKSIEQVPLMRTGSEIVYWSDEQ